MRRRARAVYSSASRSHNTREIRAAVGSWTATASTLIVGPLVSRMGPAALVQGGLAICTLAAFCLGPLAMFITAPLCALSIGGTMVHLGVLSQAPDLVEESLHGHLVALFSGIYACSCA